MSGVLLPGTESLSGSAAAHRNLLLGEFRLTLDTEDHGDEARRWMLAALDKLLAVGSSDWLSMPPCDRLPASNFGEPEPVVFIDPQQLFHKLQRLRDRLAHRMPFAVLANEIRVDLQRLLSPRQPGAAGEFA